MAIGTPTERYAGTGSGFGATSTLSPATNCTAAALLVLAAAGGFTNKVISSVSDTKGNTWTVDQTATGAKPCSFASTMQDKGTLTMSDTITITWSVSNNGTPGLWVEEVTGIVLSSRYDQTGTATGTTNGSTGAVSGGTTGTLARTNEIAFVVARFQGTATGFAASGSWSQPTTGFLSSATAGMLYQIVSATTALTPSGTLSPTNSALTWELLCVTYKGIQTFTQSLSQTQAQVPTVARQPAKPFATTQAQVTSIARAPAKTFAVAQAQVAAILRTPQRTLSFAQAQVASILRSPLKALSFAQAQVASVQRQSQKTLAVAQAQNPTLARRVYRSFATTQAQVPTVARMVARTFVVAQAQVATFAAIIRTFTHWTAKTPTADWQTDAPTADWKADTPANDWTGGQPQ